ncbi:hypothetical protein GW17_00049707 [Ensete ventricosum]|nr:hypothetical protein GW17_00049707 [Ensete ventricosum]
MLEANTTKSELKDSTVDGKATPRDGFTSIWGVVSIDMDNLAPFEIKLTLSTPRMVTRLVPVQVMEDEAKDDIVDLWKSKLWCLDGTVGARREFTRTLSKVSGRSLGTCWEIARGRQ